MSLDSFLRAVETKTVPSSLDTFAEAETHSVAAEGIRFTVPSWDGGKHVFGPAPWPVTDLAPTKGTRLLVLFRGAGIGDPWVLSVEGWSAASEEAIAAAIEEAFTGGRVEVKGGSSVDLTAGAGRLFIGASEAGSHLIIDGSSIQTKGTATTPLPLSLNPGGGNVYAGDANGVRIGFDPVNGIIQKRDASSNPDRLQLNPSGGDVTINNKRVGKGLIATATPANFSGNVDTMTTTGSVNFTAIAGHAYLIVASWTFNSSDDFPQVRMVLAVDGWQQTSTYHSNQGGAPVGQDGNATAVYFAAASGTKAAQIRAVNHWSMGGTQNVVSQQIHVIDLGQT